MEQGRLLDVKEEIKKEVHAVGRGGSRERP
jgi:hypothetical protein